MRHKQPVSFIVGARGGDGRFMPHLAEITTQEFVGLVLGVRSQIVVKFDWSQLVPFISSEFEKMRNREISDSFHALWLHWVDAPSYRDQSLRREKFALVASRAADTLTKLQSAVAEQRVTLYRASEVSPSSCLNLCSQYLAALMCCIHSKQELEVSSFAGTSLFQNYAQWIEELLLDAYARCMGVRGEWVEHSAHLYALALDEDPELELYTRALNGIFPIEGDIRIEFMTRHMRRDKFSNCITINASIDRVSREHAALASRLRDLVRWATAVRELVQSLSASQLGSQVAQSDGPNQ